VQLEKVPSQSNVLSSRLTGSISGECVTPDPVALMGGLLFG